MIAGISHLGEAAQRSLRSCDGVGCRSRGYITCNTLGWVMLEDSAFVTFVLVPISRTHVHTHTLSFSPGWALAI